MRMSGAAAVPSPADLEVEWQFDAVDLDAVERWLWSPPASLAVGVVPRGEQHLPDTYFDTADRIVGRAGYTLRLRRRADRPTEVTLKGTEATADAVDGGPRVRTELSATADLGLADLRAIDGRCGEVLRALLGTKSPAPLFEVHTTRRLFDLTLEDGTTVEAALDRTAVHAAERASSLSRVEVELTGGSRDSAGAFVAALRGAVPLRPAVWSKFGTGAMLAGLAPTEAVVDALVPGPRRFDRRATAHEVARAILRGELAALLTHEPAARLGDDSEGVHQMRVATRRMRAGLRLFRDALPPTWSAVRDEIRWLAGALGAVRDLDVQVEALEPWVRDAATTDPATTDPATNDAAEHAARLEVVRCLEARRREARAALLAALDSPRFEALTHTLTDLLRPRPRRPALRLRIKVRIPTDTEGGVARVASELGALLGTAEGPRASVRIGSFGRRELGRAHRRYRKAARSLRPGSPPETYHRVRIVAKRLRYASEFLAPLYGRDGRRFVRAVKAVQDALGEHQDAYVAAAQLRALATEEPSLSAQAVFSMGELAASRRSEAAALRRDVPRHLERMARRWPPLRRRADQIAR
jgi:CHAD domain-containing protein